MERLIVKNFGPLKNVDIEIPRLLLLIGDQATGKSTLCKIVYAFRYINQMIAPSTFRLPKNQISMSADEAIRTIQNYFPTSFDICFYTENSEITYQYSKSHAISLKFTKQGVVARFSDALLKLFIHAEECKIRLPKKTLEWQKSG